MSEQTIKLIAQSSQRSEPVFEQSITNAAHSSQLQIIPSMMISTSGLLTKWTFAAKFNHNGEERSWPELQIWRKSAAESATQYAKISGTRMEPRPVPGYLNIFEYDLSEHPIEVKAEDVLGVHQSDLENAQYTLGFLAESSDDDNIDITTNYIMYDVDSTIQEFDIIDKHEQFLLPLIFALIQGKRTVYIYSVHHLQTVKYHCACGE